MNIVNYDIGITRDLNHTDKFTKCNQSMTDINIPIGKTSNSTLTADNENKIGKLFGVELEQEVNPVQNPDDDGDDNELNGVIGNFKQQMTTGDCMILADLKALSYTSWGRELIKKTIVPDGHGGAVINFSGAPGGAKQIPVPKELIDITTSQNLVVSGDKDAAVLEIALIAHLMDMGVEITNLTGEMLTRTMYNTINESTRLSGSGLLDLISNNPNLNKVMAYNIPDLENFRKVFEDKVALMETKDSNGNNMFSVTFGFRPETQIENISTGHEYIFKRTEERNGEKYVIFLNPWDTENEISMRYDDFLKNAFVVWMAYDEKSIDKNTHDKIRKVHEETISDYMDKYNALYNFHYLIQVPMKYKIESINNLGGICEFEKKYCDKLKNDVEMMQKAYLEHGIDGLNIYIGVSNFMPYSDGLDRYIKNTPLTKQFEDHKKNFYTALGFNQEEIANIMKNHDMLKVYCTKYGYKY